MARWLAISFLLPAILLWLSAFSAAAQPEITFDQALALTEESPEVRAAERAIRARAEGDERISEAITAPTELQLMPGARILREEERGFEGQFGIVQGWSLSGLGTARRQAAGDERQALTAEVRARALERRLEAARAWVELSVLERQVTFVRAEASLATVMRERIERATDVGMMTCADVAEALAFEGEAELRVLLAEEERLSSVLALTLAMGISADERLRTVGSRPAPEVPAHDELEARLLDVEGLPAIQAARLAAIAQRARDVELAAASGPTMQTGVQVYRESPDGFMVFGQLNFGIPFADLFARERSIARAELERLEGAHEESILVARRDAVAITYEVENTRAQERVLRTSIVPALERLVAQREEQLRAGEITVVLRIEAQRRLLAAQIQLNRLEGARLWAELRAWLMLVARRESAE
jgi:outer membrane protein TolC